MSVRAIRGATTVDSDTPEQLRERMGELYDALVKENSVAEDDIVSIVITATSDIHSEFPATALREARGLKNTALLGVQEIDATDAVPLALRMLITTESSLAKSEIKHVFQHGAKRLRPDLSS
jgi:chorismate mutase